MPSIGHPDLSGKTCLVVGASRGIGAASALYLGECGAAVVLASRDTTATARLATEISARGGQALALPLDVTDATSVNWCVSETVRVFDRLELAFNNAGVQGPVAPLHEQALDDINRILDVNLVGLARCMQAEIRAMLAAGGGVIVNTASVGGSVVAPGIGPYCASKHAVVGLSKSAAADYARLGIRVNVLSPGSVRTEILTSWLDDAALRSMAEQTPQGRIADPDEIAPIVGWLLSEASTFMTGSVVTADGGYTAL